MNETPKIITAPSATDQVGLVVVFCLLTALHGPAGDLLVRTGSGLPRLMFMLVYGLSGLLLVLSAMALLAVATLMLRERGKTRSPAPDDSAFNAPRVERPNGDDDPEAWHPGSDSL
jgi:hypothetical protein